MRSTGPTLGNFIAAGLIFGGNVRITSSCFFTVKVQTFDSILCDFEAVTDPVVAKAFSK